MCYQRVTIVDNVIPDAATGVRAPRMFEDGGQRRQLGWRATILPTDGVSGLAFGQAGSCAGTSTSKQHPPSTFATEIDPACDSMTPRAMAIPRPAPASRVPRSGSPRQPISKTLARSSSLMPPHPSAAASRARPSAARRALTRTPCWCRSLLGTDRDFGYRDVVTGNACPLGLNQMSSAETPAGRLSLGQRRAPRAPVGSGSSATTPGRPAPYCRCHPAGRQSRR